MLVCFFLTGCNTVKKERNQIMDGFLQELKTPRFFEEPSGYPYYNYEYINDKDEKVHITLDLGTEKINVMIGEYSNIVHGFVDHLNGWKYTKNTAIPLYNDGKINEYYAEVGFTKPIQSFNEEEQRELNEKYFGYLSEATIFLQKVKGIK